MDFLWQGLKGNNVMDTSSLAEKAVALNMEYKEKTDIKSMNLEQLKNEIQRLGDKPFRAKQIYEWLHIKLADDFDEMSNISKELKSRLKECFFIRTVKEADVCTSKIDGTKKYLFELFDGNVIESVLMRYKHGNSVCISSQAGCRMGCRFCASAIGGKERDLSAAEMLSQIYKIQRLTGERVSNVVVMGTGEPLDNFDNLLKFLEILTDSNGLNISQRNITVSTCGIVPRIRELADKQLQITLAISLHATTDEKRKRLMPIANKYSLLELMEACRYYFDKTGRRITFEYSLVGGVNDTDEDAMELAALVGKLNCHINLIPVNPIKERYFVQSDKKVIVNFKNKLEKCRINVTIRREMGRDIDGACGQLRKSYKDRNTER